MQTPTIEHVFIADADPSRGKPKQTVLSTGKNPPIAPRPGMLVTFDGQDWLKIIDDGTLSYDAALMQGTVTWKCRIATQAEIDAVPVVVHGTRRA